MESFLRCWYERHEQVIAELKSAPRDSSSSLTGLVNRVLAHYHEYYEAKSRAASRDVLGVLFPTWLTPYERTFLWISGWKPSLAFRLITAAVKSLSPDQQRAVSELERETVLAEWELSEQLARVQEGFAMPQALTFVRGAQRGIGRAEPLGELVGDFERLVLTADGLRARTVNQLMGILNPVQMVDFLASAAQLQLCLRTWGSRRDGHTA